MLFKIHGLVAQFISDPEVSAKWIARTPPKRQVEGSNPSGPACNYMLLIRQWITNKG